MTSTPSTKTATAARVTGFLALLAAGAALLVLFAAAARAALGNSSHHAEHAVGMHRPGAAPHLRQQHSGLRKDGGRHGRPDHQLRPTGRQMAAPANCGPRTAAREASWQHCGGITRLLVPPASKALVTLTFEAIRSSSGSSDQTVRQDAGNPYVQVRSVIAGGTGRAVASAARTMARNLAVTVI
jgi:hypothetical protein